MIKILSSLALAVLALLIVCLPLFQCSEGPGPQPREDLPWQITPTPAGSITVFDLTLGESTLGEAVAKLGQHYKLGLFRDPDGHVTLEAYFKEVVLGGFSARIIVNAALDQDILLGMLGHSDTAKQLQDGAEQYPVSAADIPTVMAAPIASVTYIPYARLDEEVVLQRFGEPVERIAVNVDTQHWLYPQQGLDLILSEEGQAVLQYLPPRHFERLREPLARQLDQNATPLR
jgi:hypothetical protein